MGTTPFQNTLIGSVPAYGLLDLMAGNQQGQLHRRAVRKRAQTYRFAECTIVEGVQTLIPGTVVCGGKPLATIAVPRTIGIRFSQRF